MMRHYSAPEARVGYSIRFAAALIMVVLTATPGRGLSVETQPSEAHGKVASPLGVAGDNERQSEALKGTTASWSDNVLKEGSIDSSIAAHMELEPPAQGQFTAHSDKSGHDKPWPTGIPRVSPGNQTMIEAAAEGDPVDIYLSRRLGSTFCQDCSTSGHVNDGENDYYTIYYLQPWSFPVSITLNPSGGDADLYASCNSASWISSRKASDAIDTVDVDWGDAGCTAHGRNSLEIRVFGYSGSASYTLSNSPRGVASAGNVISPGASYSGSVSEGSNVYYFLPTFNSWPLNIVLTPSSADVDLYVSCNPVSGWTTSTAGGTVVDKVLLGSSSSAYCNQWSSTYSAPWIRVFGYRSSGYTLSTQFSYCAAGQYNSGSSCYSCGSVAYYCPGGSAATRYSVSSGYYGIGSSTTQTGQQQCPTGEYCSGGVRYNCPVGRYGSSTGLSTSSCSGACAPGTVCPERTVTPQACPAGDWCTGGINRGACFHAAFCSGSSYESTEVSVMTGGGYFSYWDALEDSLTDFGVRAAEVGDLDSWIVDLPEVEADSVEQRAILIPSLSVDISAELRGRPEVVAHLRGLVQRGAALIVLGGASDGAHSAKFLNELFGWSLVPVTSTSGSTTASIHSEASETTGFVSLSGTLEAGSTTARVLTESLPDTASRVWGDGSEWVWSSSVGCGRVIFFGQTWETSVSSEWEATLHAALTEARVREWCDSKGEVHVIEDAEYAPFDHNALGSGARNVRADLIAAGFELVSVPSPWDEALDSSVPEHAIIAFPPLPHLVSGSAVLRDPFTSSLTARVSQGATVLIFGAEKTDAADHLLRKVLGIRVATVANSVDERAAEAQKSSLWTLDTSYESVDVAPAVLSGHGAAHALSLASGQCVRPLYSTDEEPLVLGADVPAWVVTGKLGCGGFGYFAFDWTAAEGPGTRADWASLLETAVLDGMAMADEAASGVCTPPESPLVCQLDTTRTGTQWELFDDPSDPGALSQLEDHASLLCFPVGLSC